MKKVVHLIAAARPNFMKVAPLYHELKKHSEYEVKIVHTGQHYDFNMSKTFILDLGLPDPDINLGVGSGTHAEQTAGVMVAYEKCLIEKKHPDWVIVVGDVNSTMACTLAAKKMNLKVAHLEAGLRSFDRTMPEEINRIVTDSLADVLWTPSKDADVNLEKEGVAQLKIRLVGNIMIDSFTMLKEKIDDQRTWKKFGLNTGKYAVVTLHRPSNVDNKSTLSDIVSKLKEVSSDMPLVMPVHPRTKNRLVQYRLMEILEREANIHLVEPMGYIEFMGLVSKAKFVLTDSGGLQEETTFMGIPCLTLRENTERPVTCTVGTNKLISVNDIASCFQAIQSNKWRKGSIPEFWDGKTAQRVVKDMLSDDR